MGMTHDRQKSADAVGRYCLSTKINRVSLKNRPTSADENCRQTCLKTRQFVGGNAALWLARGFVVKMEVEWTDAVFVRLISMYESHACLYDPANENYRNRDVKRLKENEVAAALGKPGKFL